MLLLNFDENDFDEAFSILKSLDLSALNYLECKPVLHIIQQKNAWEFEVVILQKLIEKEKEQEQLFNLKIQLFNAYFNLKQHLEVIEIGKEFLELDSSKKILDDRNKEALLRTTVLSCLERGKVEESYYKEAQKILEKNNLLKTSFEFKVGIEAEVYLKNNHPQKALNAVIEGVKIKKIFTPQEYAKMFFLLSIKIGNQIDLKLNSLTEIKMNTFVKLENKEQWYFFGEENELDAIKVAKTSGRYQLFENKKREDKIVFESEYNSERQEDTIELIYSIDKYIFWQVVHNFQKLSKDGDLENVWLVEVPNKGDTIDLKNIMKIMEDMHKKTEPLFKLYLKNNIPLAILALNEGGITNAIGRIQKEQKGYINYSDGTIEGFEKQKEVAKCIIQDKKPFYLDGTSAIFLSEIGYINKIYKYIPNIKIPQSVINLLGEINEKFTYHLGQNSRIGYSHGKLNYSFIDKDQRDSIKTNITSSVNILETNRGNIEAISPANKCDCFSESNIPAELGDACILSQKNNFPVMTEDFMYLKFNALETKKKVPLHFSSLSLLRVLYEEKLISFDDYLEYYGYLSFYRFRFLQLNSSDIEIAVFGDGEIKTVKPENIRKLNFPLTLSEEYGVPFQTAINVVSVFFLKILIDNTITADIAVKIFVEIIESFPTKENKRDLGQMLLRICLNAIENNKPKYVLLPNIKAINDKYNKLLQATEIYASKVKLWVPGK